MTRPIHEMLDALDYYIDRQQELLALGKEEDLGALAPLAEPLAEAASKLSPQERATHAPRLEALMARLDALAQSMQHSRAHMVQALQETSRAVRAANAYRATAAAPDKKD